MEKLSRDNLISCAGGCLALTCMIHKIITSLEKLVMIARKGRVA